MAKNDDFWAKPDPGQILSGKIFCIRKFPITCRFQICTFLKTGQPEKNRISGSGTQKLFKYT